MLGKSLLFAECSWVSPIAFTVGAGKKEVMGIKVSLYYLWPDVGLILSLSLILPVCGLDSFEHLHKKEGSVGICWALVDRLGMIWWLAHNEPDSFVWLMMVALLVVAVADGGGCGGSVGSVGHQQAVGWLWSPLLIAVAWAGDLLFRSGKMNALCFRLSHNGVMQSVLRGTSSAKMLEWV